MKILKIITAVEMEMVVPIGDASQEDIDNLQSEEGQKELLESGRKEAENQAKAANGKVLSFQLRSEVVEI